MVCVYLDNSETVTIPGVHTTTLPAPTTIKTRANFQLITAKQLSFKKFSTKIEF